MTILQFIAFSALLFSIAIHIYLDFALRNMAEVEEDNRNGQFFESYTVNNQTSLRIEFKNAKDLPFRPIEDFQTIFLNICIPKLICELHAANSRKPITEKFAEMWENTSPDSLTEDLRKYHLATIMGSLFKNVDGTGCHNLYPKCPFSKEQLLRDSEAIFTREL